MAAIVPDEDRIINRYLFWWLTSRYKNIRGLAGDEIRDGLNLEMLGSIPCPIPPVFLQHQIANFLDQKTGQIDDLIQKKEKMIKLLKEKRAALINQAVTKGLNPNAKMKWSGIDWIGDIPEVWEVKKLAYISDIVLGKMLTPNDKGAYWLKYYLRAKNLGWFKVNIEDVKEMWFSNSELNIYRLQKDDLLVSEGGEVGRTCIWNDQIDECYIQILKGM